MSRIPICILASALLAVTVAAQRGVQEKGGAPAKDGGKPAPVEGAAPTEKGAAPVRVQLGEPVQPMELQTRDGGRIDVDPRAKYRTAVKMMINIDRAHRDRVARLERLRELFQASGASDKLATVARLRELESSRYEAALQGYARGLGPSIYTQVRAVIDAGAGPAPDASRPADKSAPSGATAPNAAGDAPSRGVRRERR